MTSVPEVESEISLTTDLQEVSLAAGNSDFYPVFFLNRSPVNASPLAKERAGILAKVAASPVLAGAVVELGLQNLAKIRLGNIQYFPLSLLVIALPMPCR